jgi:hypothetical protein
MAPYAPDPNILSTYALYLVHAQSICPLSEIADAERLGLRNRRRRYAGQLSPRHFRRLEHFEHPVRAAT